MLCVRPVTGWLSGADWSRDLCRYHSAYGMGREQLSPKLRVYGGGHPPRRRRHVRRVSGSCSTLSKILADMDDGVPGGASGRTRGAVRVAADDAVGVRCGAGDLELPHDGDTRAWNVEAQAADEALRCRQILAQLLAYVDATEAPRWADLLFGRFGSLAAVLAASPASRLRIAGDSRAVAFLSCVRDAQLHSLRIEAFAPPILSTSGAVLNYFRAELAHTRIETLHALYLDSRSRLLGTAVVSIGSLDEAPMCPREIIRGALELNASALILVHNHPSGDPTPSPQDRDTTSALAAAAHTLGIRLHDHLIIATGGVTSLRAQGLL